MLKVLVVAVENHRVDPFLRKPLSKMIVLIKKAKEESVFSTFFALLQDKGYRKRFKKVVVK